jgi:hypothetical protein
MKQWTPAEANRALPLVKRIVRDLVDKVRELDSLNEIAAARKQQGRHKEAREALEQVEAKMPALHALEDELAGLGVQVKDHRTGLVDFPATLRGEAVLLCWKLGEARVDHWHDLIEGFAGRKPTAGHFE